MSPDQQQPTVPQPRLWLTVHYENGTAQIVAHATQPFGAREATVHVELPSDQGVAAALEALIPQIQQDLAEQAQDAASTHRTLARNAGQSYTAPLEYVGPQVSADEATFSDQAVMALPAARREQAIKRSQTALSGGQ